MRMYVRYCGGCRSDYDRPAWVQALLEEMKNQSWNVRLTDKEEEADIRVAVCGCASRCVTHSSKMHVVHVPYIDGIQMDLAGTVEYLRKCANKI